MKNLAKLLFLSLVLSAMSFAQSHAAVTLDTTQTITGQKNFNSICLNNSCISSWPSGGGSSAFSALTSGTNTAAAMVVGSGASLTATGTGSLIASGLSALGGKPWFDVTAYGTTGNGSTDDTAAIQSAFNACFNNATVGATGGTVYFPGPYSYLISSTINAYDGCKIVGSIGNTKGAYQQPIIWWNGSAQGTVLTITAFATGTGATPTLSSPYIAAQPNRQMAYYATFTAANTLTAGQWVDIEGLGVGTVLNHTIAQVSATGLSSTQFTVGIPYPVATVGTTADSGTATTVSVAVALDAAARYQQDIQDIVIGPKVSTQSNTLDVGIYYGSRVDTGTHVLNVGISTPTRYGFYFANGGINVDFDKGWRTDGANIAGIYWRVSSGDNFGIANGTTSNTTTASTGGAAVLLDNSACVANAGVYVTDRNMKHEVNTNETSGLGVFTLYDCPSNANGEQFFLGFENVWMAPGSVTVDPGIVMSPPNDAALVLDVSNSQISGGSAAGRWIGLPELARSDMNGANGYISHLSYSPAFKSNSGRESSAYNNNAAPMQFLGDVNFNQLYQYGVQSLPLLASDTAFAVLPNGTTLYAPQVLAPPTLWTGSVTPGVYIVTASGTTGTPNSGSTTCISTGTSNQLQCTSATDLSAGQFITIGSVHTSIKYVDATNSSAVLVWTNNGVGTIGSPTALSFTAPTLSSEYQFGGSGSATSLSASLNDSSTTNVISVTQAGTGTSNPLASIISNNASASDYPLFLKNLNTSGHVLEAYSGATEVFDVSGTLVTSYEQFNVQASTAAVSGTNVSSPKLEIIGNAYGTSGSTYTGFYFWNVLNNTANTPTNTLVLGTTQGTGLTGTFGVSFANAASFTSPYIIPGTIYSAAGTALPSCGSSLKGAQTVVSDATSPTYMGAYTNGGTITTAVICSYNGSTYAWLTH